MWGILNDDDGTMDENDGKDDDDDIEERWWIEWWWWWNNDWRLWLRWQAMMITSDYGLNNDVEWWNHDG